MEIWTKSEDRRKEKAKPGHSSMLNHMLPLGPNQASITGGSRQKALLFVNTLGDSPKDFVTCGSAHFTTTFMEHALMEPLLCAGAVIGLGSQPSRRRSSGPQMPQALRLCQGLLAANSCFSLLKGCLWL